MVKPLSILKLENISTITGGIEHSCVRYADRTYVNDVIIRPDGKVYDDWDWYNEIDGKTIKNIK